MPHGGTRGGEEEGRGGRRGRRGGRRVREEREGGEERDETIGGEMIRLVLRGRPSPQHDRMQYSNSCCKFLFSFTEISRY